MQYFNESEELVFNDFEMKDSLRFLSKILKSFKIQFHLSLILKENKELKI
jgi:hypothetical protein